ncbi:MAG: hypothetical protein WKF83_09225 [Nocardioidaceae bacterium]
MTAVDQHREDLRRNYLNLGSGELVAAAAFAFIASANAIPAVGDREARAPYGQR